MTMRSTKLALYLALMTFQSSLAETRSDSSDYQEACAVEIEVRRGDYLLVTYVVSDQPVELGKTPELSSSLYQLAEDATFLAKKVFARFECLVNVEKGFISESKLTDLVRTVGSSEEGFMWSTSSILQLMGGRAWGQKSGQSAAEARIGVTNTFTTHTTYHASATDSIKSTEMLTNLVTIDGGETVLTLIVRRCQDLEAIKAVAVMDQRQSGINNPEIWKALPLKTK